MAGLSCFISELIYLSSKVPSAFIREGTYLILMELYVPCKLPPPMVKQPLPIEELFSIPGELDLAFEWGSGGANNLFPERPDSLKITS